MTILRHGRSAGAFIRLMPDPDAVNSMFGRIARRYDIANRILSGGMDVRWRRELVEAVGRQNPSVVLDLATGSGDVAFALSRRLPDAARIVGMDFCLPMLAQAEEKKSAAPVGDYSTVTFRPGDALALPTVDASCDAVTIAFGLRNLADRARGLNEMRRVLRPGGYLFVLEFSQPPQPIRSVYYFYLRRLLPRIAGRVTGDRPAYDYLNASIGEFPSRDELSREVSAAGFSDVRARALTFGIVALHEATR
jgi:demethylmenaquinone methyltransferase / 2-methoxy-6-polyprenyl-1,4-benzoquinol methylase